MTHILERADQDGIKSYLKATPVGYPLYTRLGFTENGRFELDLRPFGGDQTYYNVAMQREVNVGRGIGS